MNDITAPPTVASSTHLPPSHAALIGARLIAIEDIARDTKLYTFARAEGGRLPPYTPGAHIDLHLPNGLVRQFSLVAPNSDPDTYAVGIKRDAASRGGSRYIIDEMRVGDEIKINAPRNTFQLVENTEHVVLIAGGIGITPIWCMAQELAARKRPWKLHYACQSRQDMAFLEALQKLDPRFVELHFDDEAGVDVDYSCELGICGACETRVISGIPEHHDSVLSEEEQATNEKVMICCCGCKTERLVLDM